MVEDADGNVRNTDLFAEQPQAGSLNLEADPKISIVSNAEVVALRADDTLRSITVNDRVTGASRELHILALFIMVGAAPNIGWLADLVLLDEKAFVRIGCEDRTDLPFVTSLPGIFAVSDVRSGSVKRVAPAVEPLTPPLRTA